MGNCDADCQETLREIEAFLDGELSSTVQVRIEHHLSDCNPCMQRAEFRRHIKVMVSNRCAHEELPSGLRERIVGLLHDDA